MDSFVSLDFETTGFSAMANEIIEIGAWKVKDGVVVGKFTELVKPRGYISREIQRITGISPDMVADARDISEVLPEFYSFVEDLPFLGHNLPFDYDFLCAKGRSCGYDFSLNGERVGIDTLALSRRYFPELPSHKLASMAEQFKIQVSSANQQGYHRAAYDAYVTKLLYDRFLYLYPAVPSVCMPTLIVQDDLKYGRAKNSGTLSFG